MSDGIDKCDTDIAIVDGALVGPILRTLDFCLLHQIGEHDNRWDIVLPHHPPEVTQCVW